MRRGMPSMTALLAMLAVAGYQNRDKLAEMLGGAGRSTPPAGPPGESGRFGGQMPGGATNASTGAGETGLGGLLSGGLRDIVDRFRQAGHGETAESWVNHGPNRELQGEHLEQALGPETIEAISRQTGLSREEIVARLTRELPTAVDRYTPDGRIPDA